LWGGVEHARVSGPLVMPLFAGADGRDASLWLHLRGTEKRESRVHVFALPFGDGAWLVDQMLARHGICPPSERAPAPVRSAGPRPFRRRVADLLRPAHRHAPEARR
jgi:hypothetical protein